MAKLPTYPRLVESMQRLTTADFRKAGYLADGVIREGLIVPRQAEGLLYCLVNTQVNRPYIKFEYFRGGEHINFIRLKRIPSNLGNGSVWYFVCPRTNIRCRTLYALDGYFYHRSAFSNVMYHLQTQSKQARLFVGWGNADRLVNRFFQQPHSRTHYDGKPTKAYVRLMRKIERRDRYAEQALAILRAKKPGRHAGGAIKQ